jgi:hypothetical protein
MTLTFKVLSVLDRWLTDNQLSFIEKGLLLPPLRDADAKLLAARAP